MKKSNYEKRIMDYAYKFIADSMEYPTIENMKKVFKNCIRLPQKNMYDDISDRIIKIKNLTF